MKEIRSLHHLRNKVVERRRITPSLSVLNDDNDEVFHALSMAIVSMTHTAENQSGQYAFMALGDWLRGRIDTETFMKYLPQ